MVGLDMQAALVWGLLEFGAWALLGLVGAAILAKGCRSRR
jgi:hypothetical protein